MNYEEDIAASLKRQTSIIKKQVLLEIIQIAAGCETYDEFRKVLYARALGFMKEFEDEGVLKPGTTEKVAKGEALEEKDINKKTA